MLSDIAEPHCSDKRVKHGMDKHIGIGMTQKPLFMRDINAAQDKLALRRKSMNVHTLPHAQPSEISQAFLSLQFVHGANLLLRLRCEAQQWLPPAANNLRAP